MAYSEIYFKQKYPSGFFIVLLIPVILVLSVWFFLKDTSQSTRAMKKEGRVEIVNLTNNQAGIFWQTSAKESGWVIYGENENNLDKTAFDERDMQDNKNTYLNHYAQLANLKSNQDYYLEIINNQKIITGPNNRAFHFKTPSLQGGYTDLKPAYGKAVESNGRPLEGAVVILKIDGLYPMLTFTKSTGEWLIPLKNNISPKDKINITIYDELGSKTDILTNLDNISPLPQTINIGRTYEFIQKEDVLSESIKIDNNQGNVNTPVIALIYPKEGAIIPADSPRISGLALPDNEVVLSFNTNEYDPVQVKSDNTGKWQLSLPLNFRAGKYTITMNTKNERGADIGITRKFTIAKSGEQVMGLATSSATPTSIATPTEIQVTIVATPTTPVSGLDSRVLTLSSGFLVLLGIGLLLAF